MSPYLLLIVLGGVACVLVGILAGCLLNKRALRPRVAAAYEQGRASRDRERMELAHDLSREMGCLRDSITRSINTYQGIARAMNTHLPDQLKKIDFPQAEIDGFELIEMPVDSVEESPAQNTKHSVGLRSEVEVEHFPVNGLTDTQHAPDAPEQTDLQFEPEPAPKKLI